MAVVSVPWFAPSGANEITSDGSGIGLPAGSRGWIVTVAVDVPSAISDAGLTDTVLAVTDTPGE